MNKTAMDISFTSDNAEPQRYCENFVFNTWAMINGLSRETMNVLEEEDLNSREVLRLIDDYDATQLGLPQDQEKLLQRALRTITSPTATRCPVSDHCRSQRKCHYGEKSPCSNSAVPLPSSSNQRKDEQSKNFITSNQRYPRR